MVSSPAETPVTVTLLMPGVTVAIEGSLLLHVPPYKASLSIVDNPAHAVVMPIIGAVPFTVTVVVALLVPDV